MNEVSPQDQVPDLMDILEHEKNWQARRQALDQLLHIGSPAVPALLQELETAAQRQFSAWNPEVIEALGRLREPRAVEALMLALAQENPHLRQEAAQALGAIGDARAIASLIASFLVESGDDIEDITAWQKAAHALGHLGAPAVEPLCQALRHGSEQVRIGSAEALGLLGDPRAVEPLSAALTDQEYLVRAEAAKALGAIGDPRALSPLDTVLATDSMEYVRDYAARALGHFPAPAVFERLLQVRHDPSTEVRCGAIVALAQTAGTQAMPALVALLADSEPVVRGMAALKLASVGDLSVVPALEQMKGADHAFWGPIQSATTPRMPWSRFTFAYPNPYKAPTTRAEYGVERGCGYVMLMSPEWKYEEVLLRIRFFAEKKNRHPFVRSVCFIVRIDSLQFLLSAF